MKKIIRLKKKHIIALFLILMAFVFIISPSFSKYFSQTTKKIVSIVTEYNVEYTTSQGKIKEPNKFNSYRSIAGLVLPIEGEINRTGYDFTGWYDNSSLIGSPFTRIESFETGDKHFYASWMLSEYTLTVKTQSVGETHAGLPSGYNIVIGKDSTGKDKVINLDDNGKYVIGKNELVSIRIPYSEDVSPNIFSFSNEEISVNARYIEGDQYIYYDFYMPKGDLTLLFSDDRKNYIDIAKSSIIFEEGVNIASIPTDGFWYKSTIKGMTPVLKDNTKGNFYVWDRSHPLYVTSNGVATKNQLIVNNNITVYMKNCLMELTDSYQADVRNHHIGGTSVLTTPWFYVTALLGRDFTNYGNIIADYTLHPDYTLNLYFEGDNNQIGAIFTNQVKNTITPCINLNLYKTESSNKVKLGTVFGNFLINVNNGVEINEYDYSENSFEFLFYSYNREFNITGAVINTNNKSIGVFQSKILINNSRLDIRDIFSYDGFKCSGNTYLRVRNNIYYGFAPLVLLDTSSVVIDGNLLANYMHWQYTWTSNSTGYLIVKGNRAEVSSSTFNNTHVICNNLVVGKSFGTNNATIIANQITNPVVLGFNVENGEIVYNYTYNLISEATSNSDNYPFRNYSQNSDGDVNFRFNSDVYLFGHYKTKSGNYYDETVKAIDSDNPIKPYLDKLLDENGDLKTSAELENVDYIKDKNIIINDIKNSSNTNKETIVIGNSTYNYDVKRRTGVIDGGNIYSAGNMTFFNDLIINNGYVYANGNLSSKNDLIMNNGTVEVNSLGNAYDLKKEENPNIYLYHETEIKKGTVKANNIGAVKNELMNSSITPRSVVTIDKDNTTFSNKKGTGKPNITSDIYVNYIFNSSNYRNDNAFNSIRMKSLWNDTSLDWNMDSEVNFVNPFVIAESSYGSWKLNSLNGKFINKVGTNGDLLNNDVSLGKLYNNKNIKLYAVKNTYAINVLKDESSYTLLDKDNNPIDINSVGIDKVVNLKLTDSAYINKVVIQYVDDSGVIHNVNPTKTSDTLTFKMPPSDVNIYITNEMVLDLDVASYKITNTGYIIDFENPRDDNTFEYEGSLVIEQGSITTASTSYFNVYFSNNFTQNVILIDKEFNNIDTSNKSITLRKIYQYGTGSSIGLKLEDGAKANIKISGPVQLFRVEVPENSDMVMEGMNNVDTDIVSFLAVGQGNYNSVSLGNANGASGDIYLKNMTIYTYADRQHGHRAYSGRSTNATFTYDNCKMTNKSWYTFTSIGHNFNIVNIINSSFDIEGAPTWTNPLFSGVKYVNISNSTLNFLNNGSYESNGSYPIHFGITKELVIDNSTVTTSLREHNTTKIYKTVQGNGVTPPVVKVLNGSSYITDKRIRLKKLVVDNSTVSVGKNKDGYLFANDIELNNNAILNSGSVLISGFYDSKNTWYDSEPLTKDDVIAKLKVDSNVFNGSAYTGLVINSGTVNVKDFVGGDVNGKIVVNGGTLNAKSIGTKGCLYGFGTYVPKSSEEYVYTYSKIPAKGTAVTINGGAVNVSSGGYLGGMNAKVDVKGGQVNLADNAIIGISESDKVTLVNNITSQGKTPSELVDINIMSGTVLGDNGQINIPYSTLDIGDSTTNPAVNIRDIVADDGIVNIKNSKDYFDNPISGGKKVGVYLNNQLSAKNINITSSAIVYANDAISLTNSSTSNGSFIIDNDAYLYTNTYGVWGKGNSDFTNNGTVVGLRKYPIKYVMNDTYEDFSTNPNPEGYISGEGLILSNPEKYGHTFTGWLDENDKKITEISAEATGNKVLTATWKPDKVEFVVSIKASDVGLTSDELASQVDLSKGELVGDTFTFNEHLYINYHDKYTDNNQLILSKYGFKSYDTLEVTLDNEIVNPDNNIIQLTSETVTKKVMQAYKDNNGEPLRIKITSLQDKK